MDEGVVGVHVEFGLVDVEFGGGLEGGLFEGGVAGCTWMSGTRVRVSATWCDVGAGRRKSWIESEGTDIPRGEVLDR